VTLLLDTHFLVWIVTGSRRLRQFPWLARYRPWGVSPVSFLEIQLLSEVGRLKVRSPDFVDAVMIDARFAVDEVPLVALIRNSLDIRWTRDPFDRLLCSHSYSRRVPLCTVDTSILENHRLVPARLTPHR